MANLLLRNIDKIYDNGVQAVFDFNIDIKNKEFIVFVGPSGCGKSTTLRMVAGLETITAGELYIDGKLVNNVKPKDRDISMVFQSYALYPHMTVFKNMAFALKQRKVEMPVYEPLKDKTALDKILLEKKALRKKINKLNRKFKKNQNDFSIIPERDKLYNQLYKLVEEQKKCYKQAVGINNYQVKLNEKELKSLVREKVRNKHKLEKVYVLDTKKQAEAKAAYEKAKNAKEVDKRQVKRFKKLVDRFDYIERARNILKNDLILKDKQIKDCEEKVAYYKKSKVPVTKARHLTREEIEIEVNKTASTIDLIKYLYRKPAALSGGQRQRVALGRAIVRKPKAFLMDEPLSNLDAKLRVQTRGEIIKIHERVGATTIYVTHDQTEAMTMADRIVVMKDGYVQQIGTPDELFNKPANLFVAGFIGSPSMNFIDGTVKKGSIVSDLSKNVYKINKKALPLLKKYDGKKVIVGIRPEDFYLAKDPANPHPGETFTIKVEEIELLGTEVLVYSKLGDKKLIAKLKATSGVKVGDTIKLSYDTNRTYCFDPKSTLSIA